MDKLALRDLRRQKGSIGFDDGFFFGVAGSGFQRMSIACPRAIFSESLGRIETSVNSLQVTFTGWLRDTLLNHEWRKWCTMEKTRKIKKVFVSQPTP
jgi:hypothetical protein